MHNRKHPQRSAADTALFAERLNKLFAAIHPPSRGPYLNSEVTQTLARRGHDLSDPYLSQLRRGLRTRPSPNGTDAGRILRCTKRISQRRQLRVHPCPRKRIDWLRLARDESVREVTTALLALPPSVREALLESTSSLANLGEPVVNHPRGIRLGAMSIDV